MGHRILVPLDGSRGSEAVMSRVGELAQAERATIRLLHVAPRVEAIVVDGRVVSYADQEAARVEHEVLAYLMSAAAALSGIEVELAVRFGDPVQEILQEAESQRVDLIAMATRGRMGLRRLMHGSVAERVERASTTPVLLVAHGERAAA